MNLIKIALLVFILSITLSPQNKWLSNQSYLIDKFLKPLQNRGNLNVQRMDSIIANSVTGDRLKISFEYDNKDNIIIENITGRMSGWDQNSKIEFLYDEDNKLIQESDMRWNGTEWIVSTLYTYFYNTQDQLSQEIIQQRWSNELENFQRISYEYDDLGNQSNVLYQGWQNDWQNESLITFYYSNINRKDSILFQDWNSNEWVNSGKTFIYYNQQTQFMESVLFKLWMGDHWENAMQRKIECDQNGNQTLQTDLIWNGNEWEYSIRRFYAYDNSNYTLTAYCELWNGSYWYPGDGDLPVENPDGFSFLFFDMNNVNIYYQTTGILNENNPVVGNYILLQNYPNPFNPSTKIKYSIPTPPVSSPLVKGRTKEGFVSLKVYDVLGNEVATSVNEEKPAGTYEVEFNGTGLTSGIYFYQLQAGAFVETKKMILLK